MPRALSESVPVPAMNAEEIERFSSLIKSTRRGECWNWAGYCDGKGYGQFRLHEQSWWSHRVAYTLAKGPIPRGMHVHHACGNRSCVNPAHLQAVTPSENAIEAARHAAEIPF